MGAKSSIIDNVCMFLLKKGFTVKNIKRGCFDILAKGDSFILLIKALEDANSISKEYSDEMASVASYINVTPIIIAEKAGARLESNVVYTRFGIYTVSFSTFTNCLNDKLPFVKSTQAGLTASIIGDELRRKREERGLSINALSKNLGISGRMVLKYENGLSEVTMNKALKIYDIFGESVFRETNIFRISEEPQSNAKTELSKKYVRMGFDAADTKKSPFDIIARKNKIVIITEVGDKVHPDSLAVSKLIEADNLVIFSKKKPKDIAAITKEEFLDFEKSDELIKFLREF